MTDHEFFSVLEWAQERHANTIRLAATKTGAERQGWLEDAAFWQAIIALIKVAGGVLSANDARRPNRAPGRPS